MAYTPPSGDEVDFIFEGGYTAPEGDNVNLLYGLIAVITIDSISRNTIYDDAAVEGFDTSVVRWKSSVGGAYRMELGGNGVSTGSLVDSGNTFSNFQVRTELDDDAIEATATFSGTGSYRFNVYVKSADNIWTPYDQS